MAPLELQYTIVDAFTSRAFTGNPAAVVVLAPGASDLPDSTLQLIAREFNLSGTAFVSPTNDDAVFGIRWFTATTELRLCGHATLASAHVLRNGRVTFRSRWSQLVASKDARSGTIELAFPAGVPEAIPSSECDKIVGIVRKALGADALDVVYLGTAPGDAFTAQLLVHIDDSFDLASANVDIGALTALEHYKVIIITNSPPPELQDAGKHFVSRVFGPLLGFPEDSVTGSAHCMLAPYWAKKLGKTALSARQVSARSGDVEVEWVEGEGTVKLRGDAVTVGSGVIYVPGDDEGSA